PSAELKRCRPELGIVDPVLPLAQVPDASCHEDRRLLKTAFPHELAQLEDARIGRAGLLGVLAVGEAVMAAGEPRVLVDHAAEPVAELVIGALPERAEGARG